MAKFQKGHKINLGRAPWNKKTKGIMKPNSGSFKKGEHPSPKTEFKKGQIPWNKGIPGMRAENNPNWRGGKPSCLICGVKLTRRNYRYCEKHRTQGERNPAWRGGITPMNRRARHSLKYTLWRKSVFGRDNYTCVLCGAKSQKGKSIYLHADHIKPFAFYPELRFAVNNGRTLCKNCHSKTSTYKNNLLDRDYKTGRFIKKINYANL